MQPWRSVESEEKEAEPAAEVTKPRGASRAEVKRPAPRGSKAAEEPIARDPEIWWKPFWTYSSLLLFCGLLWGLSEQIWQWLDRPVTQVVIEGQARHLDRAGLARQIGSSLRQPLLSIDIETIREQVREHPWVRLAGIRRDWPDRLVVEIEEEVPVARWGERGLLNHQGDIFWPELKEEYRNLPRLSGPAPDTSRVMSQFHDLNQMFRSAGLKVSSLELEARGAWSLELDNQIRVVVGREAVNERLQRFLTLYQRRLKDQVDRIEQIDIRYPHGVAVKWRQMPEDENAG